MRVDEKKGEGLVLAIPQLWNHLFYGRILCGGLVAFLVYNKLSRILVMPINSSCPLLIQNFWSSFLDICIFHLKEFFLKGVLNF